MDNGTKVDTCFSSDDKMQELHLVVPGDVEVRVCLHRSGVGKEQTELKREAIGKAIELLQFTANREGIALPGSEGSASHDA